MTESEETIKSLKEMFPKGLCEDDEYNMAQVAINALEEIQQYRALGTVEELRIAKEKQLPKKVIFVHPLQENDGGDYMCPSCKTGTVLNAYGHISDYCPSYPHGFRF